MPTTISDTAGNTYHLYQLGDLSAPEPEDRHDITTVDNRMCEGYFSTSRIGLASGVRSWTLRFPTLAASSIIAAAVTDPYGATVSRENYIRNLVKHNQTTGIPFGYQWNGQYYLVDIVDDAMTMRRLRNIGIYETSLTFKQRRIDNVTVFDVNQINSNTAASGSVFQWFKGSGFSGATWTASYGGNASATGDVVLASAAVNGHDAVRLNNTASTGYVSVASIASAGISEIFIVMKMREATFSNNCGIFTDNNGAGTQVLRGTSGGTKFQNPSLSATAFSYELNGTSYAQSNLQAPMNAWGIVHARYTTRWTWTSGYRFGQDRTTAGTFAKADIAEIVLCYDALPQMIAREVNEYLAMKYDIELG